MGNVEPTEIRGLAMAIGGPDGVDVAVSVVQRQGSGLLPDFPVTRKALEAWGIKILGEGTPISMMFTSQRTIMADLPKGWEVKHLQGGHNGLFDNKGAMRLHWHIHGWDPVSLTIENRFSVRGTDIGPSHGLYQVFDGVSSIHAVPFTYPYPRSVREQYGTVTRYNLDRDALGEETYRTQGAANYKANEDARNAAEEWLAKNKPGNRDNLKSWSL